MFPIKIRYKRIFVFVQLFAALLLIFLSFYNYSIFRIILGIIWLFIGMNNLFTAILEVDEKEIVVRNVFGFVTQRIPYQQKKIEVREYKILMDDKVLYKHSFVFVERDFEKVRAYLSAENPDIHLKRHLIDED